MDSPVKYNRNLRYWSVIVILSLAGLLIAYRYWSIARSGEAVSSVREQRSERGRILDRNGVVLAVDTPIFDIGVWRKDISRELFAAHAPELADAVGMSTAELLSRWDARDGDLFYVRKRALPQIGRKVKEYRQRLRDIAGGDKNSSLAIEAQKMLGAITVDEISGRLYPEGRLAAHLIGFVGSDNRGLEGVEKRYDEELTASQPTPPQGVFTEENSLLSRGRDIVLTIDADLQYLLEQLARKTRRENQAESVMILVQDVRTGELLAYVCMPDYDPNNFAASTQEERRDLPATYAYEPGSVFKVYSLASILDIGAITEFTPFECNGEYVRTTASGEQIVIKDLGSYGTLTIDGVLAHSSNVGTALASERIDAIDLYEHLNDFGFGNKLGIALMAEAKGNLREVKDWSARSKPTIAFGQELTTTALQMVNAAGTVGNLGRRMKPYIIRSVLNPDGSVLYEFGPSADKQVIKPASARTILRAMESAASMEGTGWRAKIEDLRMAVKTGTAQMYDPETKRYSEKDFIASTLAILPADDPRVAVYVAIVKPRGEQYLGGRIAAPVVKEAAEAVLSILPLARGGTPTITHSSVVQFPGLASPRIDAVMPDLAGTPKRLFLSLLGRQDLRLVMTGEGYVYKQSPAPGTLLQPGSSILLEFR